MLVAIGAAYIRGLFIPLLNNDSAHHANIALTMYETGDFVSLIDRGVDYLDKPHLLFWLSALSYKVFGVNAFAFRFPSFLFSILAGYATYSLASILYSKKVGILSATILITSYGFFLANTDVRMDAILTGCIIFSIWQLIIFAEQKTRLSLFLSALGLALGFATKGAVGIVVPSLAVFFYVAYRRNLQSFLNVQWLLLGLVVMLLLLPVFYCFYLQFDLHPEKVIRGTSGNSGINFLLLGQSVQRYSGTGWGTTGTDPFFFVHTFLWAFLPWSILAIVAVWRSLQRHVQTRFIYSPVRHLFIPATIVVLFIILSGSHFKLPHYLNILFPLFAISTASFIKGRGKNWKMRIRIIQYVVVSIIFLITIILNLWLFPPSSSSDLTVIVALAILLLALIIIYRKQYLVITLIAIAMLFLTLNFTVFPGALELQAGNVLAQKVKETGMSRNSIHYLKGHEMSNSFDFHLGRTIRTLPIQTVVDSHEERIIYTDEEGRKEIEASGLSNEVVGRAVNLKITRPSTLVLDPEKRGKSGPWHYLIRVNPTTSASF